MVLLENPRVIRGSTEAAFFPCQSVKPNSRALDAVLWRSGKFKAKQHTNNEGISLSMCKIGVYHRGKKNCEVNR